MDITVLNTIPLFMGSLVGAAAVVTAAWITQRTVNKRKLMRRDVRVRETLYGEYMVECATLLMDALSHKLERPQTLLGAYSLINRIRMCASETVLKEAERLLRRVTEQYFAENLPLEELRRIARAEGADPLEAFGNACRLELEGIRERI